MRYSSRVLDRSDAEIKPVLNNGTPAQHFAACLEIYIRMLNEADSHMVTLLMMVPGIGVINATQGVAMTGFIARLHEHPVVDANFLGTWGNIQSAELRQALAMPTSNPQAVLLFLQFLRNIHIPEVARCEIRDAQHPVQKIEVPSLKAQAAAVAIKNKNKYRYHLLNLPGNVRDEYPELEVHPARLLKQGIRKATEGFTSAELTFLMELNKTLRQEKPYNAIHKLLTENKNVQGLKATRAGIIKAMHAYNARKESMKPEENVSKFKDEVAGLLRQHEPGSFDSKLYLGLEKALLLEDPYQTVVDLLKSLKQQNGLAYEFRASVIEKIQACLAQHKKDVAWLEEEAEPFSKGYG